MDCPTLNIILDSRFPEKYQNVMNELSAQQITNYEIWPCLIYPDVVSSINASHKMIVRNAKEKGLKECVIAEDDFWFPAKDGWQYFLDNKPDDYDIYAGGNYLSFQRPEKNGLVKADCVVGLHCYFIHERYYDKFLSTPDNKHIDTEQKGIIYVVYPFAALQRTGFSANNKAIANYNSILKDEDVYGKFR